MHLAIPRFENAFLTISRGLGADITALEQTNEIYTRRSMLSSSLVLSEPLINIWGIDYCRFIDFLLLEPLGYRLRHRIAHGEMVYSECTIQNSLQILVLYLFLLAKVEITS